MRFSLYSTSTSIKSFVMGGPASDDDLSLWLFWQPDMSYISVNHGYTSIFLFICMTTNKYDWLTD